MLCRLLSVSSPRPRRLPALFIAVLPVAVVLALSPPAPTAGADTGAAIGGIVAPATEGTRGPQEVAFTPDGRLALVTEHDANALAVIDVAGGRVLAHVPTGGERPTGVAIAHDGRLAVATNSYSGTLAVFAISGSDVRRTAVHTVPGLPYDVVLAPDGTTAYVAQSQLDSVAVMELQSGRILRTLPTGRRPRALALTADGATLVCANMTEGSVSFLDPNGNRPPARGRTPAVNLRGVAVFPGGRMAYPVGQRAQNERPTESAVGIWSNQAFRVVPNGPPNGAENIWLDLLGTDVADPDSVVFDARGEAAYVTCSGGHSVNVLPLRGRGDVKVARGVGAFPRGLAFTPDGAELWVACQLSNDIAVLDPSTLAVRRRVSLGPPPRRDPHLEGRFLFVTAGIVDGGQFSCNSCHPDGHTDGISWKFVHVPDALGKETPRNVRSLLGGLRDTDPFRWSGHDKTLEQFVQEEVTGLLRTPALPARALEQLVAFVEALPLPPNPYRRPDGTHTEAGRRGEVLFSGKAGCVQCHTGPRAGGQRLGWVGTTPAGVDLDVPHLRGVHDSYPYLHDGRAPTLESIFTEHNAARAHGRAHELSPGELGDLVQYLREL